MPQKLLFKRILIVFGAYSLCRLLFYIFNASLFSFNNAVEVIQVFIGGLRFDASAIVMTNAPFIVLHLIPIKAFYNKIYQKILLLLFIIINGIAITLNCIDFSYYKFILKRSTLDVLTIVKSGNEGNHLLSSFTKDFWYVPLIAALIIWAMSLFYKRIEISKPVSGKTNLLVNLVSIILILGSSVLAVRGGFQYRPLGLMNATQVTNAAHAPLVLNTPFSIIRTISKNELKDVQYMSDNEVEKLFDINHTPQINTDSAFNKLNVVIIILEGIGKEYIGSLSGYKTYTPFLDSLFKQSYVFTNAYANGKRSIEGIPAIVASLPTLMNNSFITSAYSGNKINSLASLLKQEGYITSFYHGGNNGTMGFDNFVKAAGFDNYYGRNEYNNDTDFDGAWGIPDEPFLQYFANSLTTTKQPFFSTVFTLSSHHPFKVPEKYNNRFTGGPLPIHATVQYADFALQQFFKQAQQQPWFNKTLFVITSDHTAIPEHAFYKTNVGSYAIPIAFYIPSQNLIGTSNSVVQQTDIMPTVLNLLNYNKPYVAFGNNMLDNATSKLAFSFNNGAYQLIKDDYSIQFNGSENTGLFNYKTDSTLSNNLSLTETAKVLQMQQKLKAIIQTYNKSMIYNKLSK